jgi:hypothetical protein
MVVTVVDWVVGDVTEVRVVGTVVWTTDDVGLVETVDLGWVTAGADVGVVADVAGGAVTATAVVAGGAVTAVVTAVVDEVLGSVLGTNTGAGVVLTEPAAARATPPASRTKTRAAVPARTRRMVELLVGGSSDCAPPPVRVASGHWS